MLLQPGVQVLVAVDLALQLLQGIKPGLGLCQHPLLLLQRIALVAALRIGQRQLFLQLRQFLDLMRAFRFELGQLLLRLLQRVGVGARQIVLFHQQAQTPRIQLLDVALQIGTLGLGQLHLLLQQQMFALQFVVAFLGNARRLFRLRQVPAFRLGQLFGFGHFGTGAFLLALPVFQQRMHTLALVLLLFDLALGVGQLLRHALALLGDVLDVLLQPRDLGIRRV